MNFLKWSLVMLLAAGCAGPDVGAPPVEAPAQAATVAPGTQVPGGGFKVVITTSSYGLVSATTSRGATCTATAVLPSGRTSTAQGLGTTQIADGSGKVSWSYRTVSNTTKGTGTHTVKCRFQGGTGSASASFTVQ